MRTITSKLQTTFIISLSLLIFSNSGCQSDDSLGFQADHEVDLCSESGSHLPSSNTFKKMADRIDLELLKKGSYISSIYRTELDAVLKVKALNGKINYVFIANHESDLSVISSTNIYVRFNCTGRLLGTHSDKEYSKKYHNNYDVLEKWKIFGWQDRLIGAGTQLYFAFEEYDEYNVYNGL